MTFADITPALRAHLLATIAPVPVSTRVPDARPAEFVQLRPLGGPAVPPVREIARFDVFVWAATEPRAVELGLLIRAAVWALAGTTTLGQVVYDVAELRGPGLSDDPQSGTPRSWATYNLTIRADAAVIPAEATSQ